MDNTFFKNLSSTPVNTNNINKNIEDRIQVINTQLDNIQNNLSNEYDDIKNIVNKKLTLQIKNLYKIHFNQKINNTSNFRKRVKQYIKNKFTAIDDNKCLKKIPYMIEGLINKSENIIKSGFSSLTNIFKYGIDILSSFWSFLSTSFYKSVETVNNLLYGIPGKMWESFKNLFSPIGKVISWVVGIGTVAFEYIWKGVSTIFKIGIDALYTISSYVYKGAKWFFIHWFKMLVNTIINPTLWIVNIPLFILITTVALSALGIVLISSAAIILPILEKTFDLLNTVGGWIYDGISWIVKWISTQYKDSWLQNEIVNPFIKYIQEHMPAPIKEFYNKIVNWGTIAIDWVQKKLYPIQQFITEQIGNVKEFLGKNKGQTFFRTFLNVLINLPLPATFKNSIKRQFGFIIQTVAGTGIPLIPLMDQVSGQISATQKNIVSNFIELQFEKMKKENPEIDEKSLINKLNSEILPDMMSTTGINLSDEDMQNAVKSGIDKAKNALDGKLEFINDNYIKVQTSALFELYRLKKIMLSGDLNALDPKVYADIEAKLTPLQTYTDSINVRRTSKSPSQENIDKLSNYMTMVKRKYDTLSTKQSLKEYDTAKSEHDTALNSLHLIFSDFFVDTVQSQSMGMFRVTASYTEAVRGQLTPSVGTLSDTSLYTAIPEIPHANGNIIIPSKTDVTKTIPLNTKGAQYIRDKIKEINYDKNIFKQSSKTNITTIIDQNIEQHESYEIYTLNHISKGILRT